MSLSNEQLLMIDALTYYSEFSDMKKDNNGSDRTIGMFLDDLEEYNYKTCFDKKFLDYTDEKLGMKEIVEKLKNSENYNKIKNLVMVYPDETCEKSTTSSVCLVDPETAEVYVIYGGNYSEPGYTYKKDGKEIITWVENAKGASELSTDEQERQLDFYIDSIVAARKYLGKRGIRILQHLMKMESTKKVRYYS